MKKTIVLMSSMLIALLGMFLPLHDAFAVDPPHNGQNNLGTTMTCNSCHYDTTGPTPTWAQIPPSGDNTFYNNLCTSCHMVNVMTDSAFIVKTHSSANTSGNYGYWTVECIACHNPHYQDQVSSYPTDTTANLFTGTIQTRPSPTVGAPQTVITVNAPGMIANAWIDYIMVPDVLYPTKMYLVKANTTGGPIGTITVIGAVNPNYAAAGRTFAIRLPAMVKGQLLTPNGTTSTVKFFTQDNRKPNSYAWSTDSNNVTGICQVCHTKTTSFNSLGTFGTGSIQESPTHPNVIGTNQVCTECHIHKDGFKGTCTSCHGSPPVDTATLVFKDSAGTATVSDSFGAGAHAKHVNSVGYTCATCHTGGMLSGAAQGDNKINIGFYYWGTNLGGKYDGKSGRTVFPYAGGGTTTVTATGPMQCSNIYCHSSGQGTTSQNATPVYAAPQWNVPGSGACGTCHGVTNATLTSGNHAQHLTGYATTFVGCGDCHTGAAPDASSYASPNHVNQLIDVANGYSPQGSAGNGYGRCNAASCHGSGTPVWGMNVAGLDKCTVCHGTPTAGALGSSGAKMAPPFDTAQSSSGAKVGAHQAHLTSNSIASPVPCQECHIVPATVDAPGHIKDSTPGVAEVDFTNAATANFNGAVPVYASGVCSNTYCHGAKMIKLSTEGTDTSPSWADTGYITGLNTHDCGMCHGFPPTTVAPGSHLTGTVKKGPSTCIGCHTHTNASGTGFTNIALHINKFLDVSGCNGCHGQSGPTGAPLVPGDLVSPPTGHTVGMHPKHVDTVSGPGYSCNTCHAGNTMPTLDSILTISFAGFGQGGSYQGTALTPSYSYSGNVTIGSTQQCSNIYCHGSSMAPNGGLFTNPVWTNAASGACGACHGATAANPPTKGSHAVHAASFTNAGYQLACTLCHVNYAAQHVDGQSQVAFNTADGRVSVGTYTGSAAMLDAYGGCSNVYCHSQGNKTTTPYAAPNAVPIWGATLDCAGCHGNSATSSKLLTSGAHSFHLNDGAKNRLGRNLGCADCHNATVSSDTIVNNYVNHANQLVNIRFNSGSINKDGDAPAYEGSATTGSGAAVTAGAGNNTCSNLYCHSIGNLSNTDPTTNTVVPAGVLSFRTPTWTGGAGLDCDNCHGDQSGKAYPTYATGSAGSTTANSHPKHIESAGHTCNICHVTTTLSTTISVASMTVIPGGDHLNRVENVVFATISSKTGIYNSGKTCSATYCHGSVLPSPAWGGTTDCGSCHDSNSNLPGKHALHYGSTTTATAISSTNTSTGTSYGFGCGVCHPNNQHATKPVNTWQTANVVFDATYAVGGTYSGGTATAGIDGRGYNWTAGQLGTACNNTYCHSQGTTATGPFTAPNGTFNWATATVLDCAGCHGNSPTSSKLLTSNAHSAHINDGVKNKAGRSFGCTECHNATALNDTTMGQTQNHVNQLVNIKFNNGSINKNTDLPTYESVSTTGANGAAVTAGTPGACSNVYCHSIGNLSTSDPAGNIVIAGGGVSFRTPTFSAGVGLNCDACHGGGAGTGIAYPNYLSGSKGTNTANSHVAHVATNGYTCNICHVATTVSTTITAATMTLVPNGSHLNRVEDVSFVSLFSKTGSYNFASKTCSATYCHGTGTPQWGDAAGITCASCHLGSGDLNNFAYNDGNLARIDQTQWLYSGHGKTTGLYDVTSNSAANLPGLAGTGDPCLYCHNDGVGHGDSLNVFRLRSFTSGSVIGMNKVCLNCHATGAAGVNPFSGNSQTVVGANKVDKFHYGGQHSSTLNGGQFCWDCHEPHGDSTSAVTGPIAMIQARPTMSSDLATGKPITVVSSTVSFTTRNTGASYGTMTAPFDKICNVCHTYKAASPNKMVHYTTSTSDGHNQGTVCTSCHKHSGNTTVDGEAFKGGACDGCHGYPPKAGEGLVPYGYMPVNGVSVTVFEGRGGWATGPTFSGGHKAHVDHLSSLTSYSLTAQNDAFVGDAKTAILCGTCHDLTTSNNHSTDGFGTRLINFSSSLSYSFGTLPPTYNGVPGVSSTVKPKTCSNVSCHFTETPLWQDTTITN